MSFRFMVAAALLALCHVCAVRALPPTPEPADLPAPYPDSIGFLIIIDAEGKISAEVIGASSTLASCEQHMAELVRQAKVPEGMHLVPMCIPAKHLIVDPPKAVAPKAPASMGTLHPPVEIL